MLSVTDAVDIGSTACDSSSPTDLEYVPVGSPLRIINTHGDKWLIIGGRSEGEGTAHSPPVQVVAASNGMVSAA
jgi:hypothetical protein